MSHLFLTEWASWIPGNPPYEFPGDQEALRVLDRRRLTCSYSTWAEYMQCEHFAQRDDKRLHLGLLPHPFAGDLLTARVIILMLNPGLGPHDCFGELTQHDFRAALLANLRGEPTNGGGFLFLDPHFGWHGGFMYWHSKLYEVVDQLSKAWGVPYPVARDRVKRTTATIELVPYHSATFAVPGSVIARMRSVMLARQFVHEVLVPRAVRGECLLLVTRKACEWALEPAENIVVYDRGEAQAAHLTPRSRGGARIFSFLAGVAA